MVVEVTQQQTANGDYISGEMSAVCSRCGCKRTRLLATNMISGICPVDSRAETNLSSLSPLKYPWLIVVVS